MSESLMFVMLVLFHTLQLAHTVKDYYLYTCIFFLVKTRKEAKRLAITDSLAASKSRIEELRNTLRDCKGKRDEYSTIISQQSLGKLNLFSSAHS